ncbi:glycosyltransferase [Tetragenococcus halophilus]|uniref:N-acetylglucosaminyldiphosphoundecaprenol N-acetyl-beta-D-mannosaminyltransferase n=1 Tax=Tetragenococcus halophilus TaxID=51669 RepID=A0A3G5FJV9_TETHA|nr:WecB/TagA/CpsF family glycosyltransferase [Tetragenococcus halophilus]AYW50624.1 glycosyltransferase [Tetragenococcus halophilus]MCF1601775.1 WecB/TagA/CpsF family glycosyltransferase [Tetragenococcus halophilus]GBD63521.1 UDP-N-acetylmannosamine--N-acetylglucosaminyldiphosphoundecaprenol N-acetylmannosaminyltransferase [Tetragenococcus halophilus subsp. flandriensis]
MITEEILGFPVDAITYDDIINDLPKYMQAGKKMSAISVNPQVIVESQNYPMINKFIKQSTHRIPDGIGVVLVSKLTAGKIKERVAGIELMQRFLAYADLNKKSVFFYGARPEVVSDAAVKVKQDYPNLTLSGTIDGYTKLTEAEVVANINKANPDFLFVALGFPKQEEWLARNIPYLNVSIFQDVGGSLDVLSGHVKRAPKIFIRCHLEWLYRSLSDPKRLRRITQLPVFVFKSLWWKVRTSNDKKDY